MENLQVSEDIQREGFLDRYFNLRKLNTNLRTEIIAGLTTFITMSYIIIVNPNIIAQSGMPIGAVMVATILISALSSILMGLYANLPFGMAPGMGGNAFFAVTIVAGGLATWQTALGMVFIAGVAFLILTLFGIREAIVNSIPKSLKISIGAAVGMFIALLGFSQSGIIVVNAQKSGLTLGDINSVNVLLSLIGVIVILGLMVRKVKVAILIGIAIVTLLGIPFGITKVPHSLIQLPPNPSSIIFQVDWLSALKLSFFPLMFSFFAGEFFSTLGTVLGVSGKAGLLDKNGNLPNIQKPFLVDSIATIGGGLMGVTTVATYVESASGVEAGGRTGLTSISVGFFFLISLLLTPLFLMVPGIATAPALIVIGLSMLSTLKELEYDKLDELAPAFIMLLITGFSNNLADGIVFGVLTYITTKLIAGKIKEIPIGLYFLAIPLVYYLTLA
ncbi:NCS2 family permease [Terrilactibacillus laevilacticus]|uniref:NCS2 family permease n=1 Tax=Terrilactibacillus laevilacticus TaxID=1380157 RepID=A0ABW5PRI9_9BACI|nr:NCS2 family permease [Terrilactibacillus laevilacticus]